MELFLQIFSLKHSTTSKYKDSHGNYFFWQPMDPWTERQGVHGAMGFDTKSFTLVWWWHQPLSRSLFNDRLSWYVIFNRPPRELIDLFFHHHPFQWFVILLSCLLLSHCLSWLTIVLAFFILSIFALIVLYFLFIMCLICSCIWFSIIGQFFLYYLQNDGVKIYGKNWSIIENQIQQQIKHIINKKYNTINAKIERMKKKQEQ